MSSLKRSFIFISLKIPSDIYFWDPFSICDIFRGFLSSLGRLVSPSYVIGCYWVFSVFLVVLGCFLMVLGRSNNEVGLA